MRFPAAAGVHGRTASIFPAAACTAPCPTLRCHALTLGDSKKMRQMAMPVVPASRSAFMPWNMASLPAGARAGAPAADGSGLAPAAAALGLSCACCSCRPAAVSLCMPHQLRPSWRGKLQGAGLERAETTAGHRSRQDASPVCVATGLTRAIPQQWQANRTEGGGGRASLICGGGWTASGREALWVRVCGQAARWALV